MHVILANLRIPESMQFQRRIAGSPERRLITGPPSPKLLGYVAPLRITFTARKMITA
ncbi:hypothetical protein HK097_009180 [Rhizophlyctis rosea]|uniref:Uncharacterized protein n=1 Tax=Rhizophlyctis rosea TaxID=64517 RepID=A0AAD5SPQ5_9FUNG|nr:hypothetical protein HK097_009180 [Rhizophlyctis rosea]